MPRYEGQLLSGGGNGRSYVLILEAGPSADTTQSKMFFARFSTKVGFCRVNNLFPVCKETLAPFNDINLNSIVLSYLSLVGLTQLFM